MIPDKNLAALQEASTYLLEDSPIPVLTQMEWVGFLAGGLGMSAVAAEARDLDAFRAYLYKLAASTCHAIMAIDTLQAGG